MASSRVLGYARLRLIGSAQLHAPAAIAGTLKHSNVTLQLYAEM